MVNKHYEAIHRYDFLTKELLQEEYIKNGLNDSQIAEKYNMPSKVVVWRKRKQYSIENRYKNKSNKNATVNRKFEITKLDAEELLKQSKTFEEISEIMGCSILVAKRRFKELGLTVEQKQTCSYSFYDVELTDGQKQLVMGSTLGDGTLTVSGAYSCSHSIKQKEYFDYKRSTLYNLHSNHVQRYTHDNEKLTKPTDSIHFTTGCNKYLYEMRSVFYPEGIKIFPYDFLMKNLTEVGLSYWYFDDGSHDGYKSCRILTYGYSLQDHNLMQKLFLEKFNINIIIGEDKKRGEHRYYIRMVVKESEKFISLISSFVAPGMEYKLGINNSFHAIQN